MASITHSFQEMLLPGGYLASGGVTISYDYVAGSGGSYWDPPEPSEISWSVESVDGITVYYPDDHERAGEPISEEDMLSLLPVLERNDTRAHREGESDDTIERILRETADTEICEAIEESERNTDHDDYDPRDWLDETR